MKTTVLIFGVFLALTTAIASGGDSWIDQLSREAPKLNRSKYAWSPPTRQVGVGRTRPLSASAQRESPDALSVKSADPGIYVFDGVAFQRLEGEEARQYVEAMQAQYAEVGKARSLARSGKLAAARKALESLVRTSPYDEYTVHALADVCLAEKKFSEALALLAPILSPHSSEQTLLSAAYAAAMTNRTYPGMKRYCDGITERMIGRLDGGETSIPTRTDAAAIKVSATLAMGAQLAMGGDDWAAKPYFQYVLRMDSRNAWAGYCLGGIWARANALAEAKTAYTVAARNSSGELKRAAERELAAISYRLSAGG